MFSPCSKNPFTGTSKIKVLNRFCLTIAILMILLAVSLVSAGCSSGRNVELGVNNRDTITSDDPSEGEDLGGGASSVWWYHTYNLDVEEGYPYEFTLTSIDGNTMGIWSEDKGSWIVEVSPSVSTRTATYRFESGGKQKLWVEAAEVPSEYVWYVTR
jgi:hypothetical protein